MDDFLEEWNYRILTQQIEVSSNSNDSTSSLKQLVCSFILSCFGSKEVVVHRKIAMKVKELNEKLDSIEQLKKEFGFDMGSAVASSSQEQASRLTTSLVDESEVVGRENEKQLLISKLLSWRDRAIQIVSIVGQAGVGKTTLAQLAYNSDQVNKHFEWKAWACVSEAFDEIRVAKQIVEGLDLRSRELNELDPLLQKIRDSIPGKRFFLVLDDVWTEESMKWEVFKDSLKYGASGSTILVTTRSEKVARAIGSSVIELGVLSESDSWLLFRHVAFAGQSETESEKFVDIGKEIVGKYKGLPLAIKAVGGLLRCKNTVKEWQNVVDGNVQGLEGVQEEIFSPLYASYKSLPLPVRRCFSYFAVFPRDDLIEVDDLITIWKAQGYLDSFRSKNEMELGEEYLKLLEKSSLIQVLQVVEYGEKIVSCKMHDIVHDFAKFLIGKELLVISHNERRVEFSEGVHHLSWLGSGEAIGTLPDCNMRKLHSFSAKNLKLEGFTVHLFKSLKVVRVLKLDKCGLKELPQQIGNLIHLRYLGLGDNIELREFPSVVYALHKLETLNLQGCSSLKELPPGIEKLTRLRHLIASRKDMKYPEGIGQLEGLLTLSHFTVEKGSNKFEYLKKLNRLQASLEINIRDNLDNMVDAENADLKTKGQIKELKFSLLGDVTKDVMEALQPPANLRHLIVCVYGNPQLPTWMISLKNLKCLKLVYFFKVMSLPSLGLLSSLEKLQIMNFPQLKLVDPTFLGLSESLQSPPAIAFPKLRELEFVVCKRWVEWKDIDPKEEDNNIVIMPCLRRLIINNCPKLKALPHHLLSKASLLEGIIRDGKECNPSAILSTDFTVAENQAGGQSRSSEPVLHLGSNSGPTSYPVQPEKVNCEYFWRTGFCRYGDRCRFYHPQDHSEVLADRRASGAKYLERMEKPVCQYYMRTGMCKFGASCKYHHSRHEGRYPTPMTLNIYGYPLKPGEDRRSYYRKTEQLKVHVTCKFHHAEPAGEEMPLASPGPWALLTPAAAPLPVIDPVASFSNQPTEGADLVDEITETSRPSSACTRQCLSVAASAVPSSSGQKERTETQAGMEWID